MNLTMLMGGEGYHHSEFSPRGKLANYDLFLVEATLPTEIGMSENGVKVEMGDLRKIRKGEVAYSNGANPCIIVASILENGNIWLLHSFGSQLDSEQEVVINAATTGIAGGNPELLDKYSNIFEHAGIKSFSSTDPKADFNVAIVRKKIRDIPHGIHYGYGNIISEISTLFTQK